MNSRINKRLGFILIYTFLTILLLITIYPLLYIVFGSFKSNHELVAGGFNFIPENYITQNYIDAWQAANFAKYTWNSIYMSTAIMAGSLIISSMAGYCLARKNFIGKKLLTITLISFMFINVGSVTLRPLLNLAVAVKLNTSLLGVILISIGLQQATNIFLVNGYMKTIPKELDEAAIVDGCSFFKIYYLIILPMLKPILATIALLSFRAGWNEYILPLIFTMTNQKLRPLTVGVLSLRNMEDGAAAWNLMFAGSTLSIMPIVILYLFTSKYFISGLAAGAVKG